MVEQLAFRKRVSEASKARRTKAKAPRARPPTNAVRDYTRALTELFDPLDDLAMEAIEKILPSLVDVAPLPRADGRMDADGADVLISRTMRGIRVAYASRVNPETVAVLASRSGNETSQHNRREINRQFRSVLGIDLPTSDPFLADQLALYRRANVQLVTRMSEEQLARLEETLTAAARTGSRVETIREQVRARLGVTRSRAALIARDQVLKLNGELTQLRHREAGIDEYEWITSGDERVRDRHAELGAMSARGATFKWSEPPVVDTRTGRRAHPGEDFQCRCTANPVFRIRGERV
jgi:SPP1 gp7 family putative phage head morphogenesis protein